jgi:hypothetical protein
MIKIIIIAISVIWLYLVFIIYCALASKKPTPRPGKNFTSRMMSGAA